LSRWLPVDVLDYSQLQDAIQEIAPTDVIHLAARTDTDGRYLSDYRINIEGTRHVGTALRAFTKRASIVHVSSQFVVGPGWLPLTVRQTYSFMARHFAAGQRRERLVSARYDINICGGYFNSTMVFRTENQKFEIDP
jgi:nucleoside-diphosphate-sugar epimerase